MRSLQFKATLLLVTLIVAVAVIGTAFGLHSMTAVLYANENSRAVKWATSLATGSAHLVQAGDRAQLSQIVANLTAMDGAAYAVFARADGQVLASSESKTGMAAGVLTPDHRRLLLGPAGRPKLWSTGPNGALCVDVLVPVYAAGSEGPEARAEVGYLRFASDVSEARERLENVAHRIIRTTIICVALLVPVCLMITRRAVAPIKALVRTAHAIADGTMDARAPVRSQDEIGTLADSFNTMASRVAESQMELLKLNAELEERVQQRTRDLEELAARDPLTGLYNRRYFGEVIVREFAAAERYGDDLTCLMFDIDHFKLINDRYGHRTGDSILTVLGGAIAGELRSSDIAARFGGDEFVLLLPQTAAIDASSLAERIVRAFTLEVTQLHPGVDPTLSIGVASLKTTRSPSSEALIHEADVALYAAKQGGRNRTVQATRANAPTVAGPAVRS